MTDGQTMLFAVDNSLLTFLTSAAFYTHFIARVVRNLAKVTFNWSLAAHYFSLFLRILMCCFQSGVCTFLLFTLDSLAISQLSSEIWVRRLESLLTAEGLQICRLHKNESTIIQVHLLNVQHLCFIYSIYVLSTLCMLSRFKTRFISFIHSHSKDKITRKISLYHQHHLWPWWGPSVCILRFTITCQHECGVSCIVRWSSEYWGSRPKWGLI